MFNEIALINNILAEYYSSDELNFETIMETYIDTFVSTNSVKMNKKIIKFYYNSSIKKIIRKYKPYIHSLSKSQLFMNLTSIIIYNKIYDIIENEINNDDLSNADTNYDYE